RRGHGAASRQHRVATRTETAAVVPYPRRGPRGVRPSSATTSRLQTNPPARSAGGCCNRDTRLELHLYERPATGHNVPSLPSVRTLGTEAHRRLANVDVALLRLRRGRRWALSVVDPRRRPETSTASPPQSPWFACRERAVARCPIAQSPPGGVEPQGTHWSERNVEGTSA